MCNTVFVRGQSFFIFIFDSERKGLRYFYPVILKRNNKFSDWVGVFD